MIGEYQFSIADGQGKQADTLKDEEGKVNLNVRFADEDVWLTRENLAEIYATTPQNISLHVGNIYQDKELSEEGTRKKFFLVRQEGKRQVHREIDHYNLDMIIFLGYKSTHTHNGSAYYVVLLMTFSTKVFSKGVTNETNTMNINNLQQ